MPRREGSSSALLSQPAHAMSGRRVVKSQPPTQHGDMENTGRNGPEPLPPSCLPSWPECSSQLGLRGPGPSTVCLPMPLTLVTVQFTA